jgi:hypothetical protein
MLLALGATALSAVAFGRPVLGHLGSRILGDGRDPQVFVWMMSWWPHAIAHGLGPVTTHALWAHRGFDLLWTSSVPGLSLLATPVTLLWGPVASYNVMALAAPGLAGGAVYLLSRGLGAHRAAAAAAGLLFAICPYEAATTTSHLHLSFVAPAILAAALVVWAPAARPAWIAGVGAAAAFEFLVAPEVFMTSVAAGATALALVAWLHPEARPAVVTAARTAAAGVALAVLVTSPLIVRMAVHGPGRLYQATDYSADALNFIVPTVLTALRPPFAGHVAANFPGGNPAEQGGYLGIVVVALLVGLVARRATRRAFAVPLLFIAVASLASLGPRLSIDGSPGGLLPMAIPAQLPLLDNVLPVRLAVFVWLGVCIVFALWLSRGRRKAPWVLFALAALSVAPAVGHVAHWYSPAHTGRFFADHADRRLLRTGEDVLVVPINTTDAYSAQAAEGFRYSLVNGMRPTKVAYDPSRPATITPLLRRDQVDVVVVDGQVDANWRPTFLRAGLHPRRVAGVFLYRWHWPGRVQRADDT